MSYDLQCRKDKNKSSVWFLNSIHTFGILKERAFFVTLIQCFRASSQILQTTLGAQDVSLSPSFTSKYAKYDTSGVSEIKAIVSKNHKTQLHKKKI